MFTIRSPTILSLVGSILVAILLSSSELSFGKSIVVFPRFDVEGEFDGAAYENDIQVLSLCLAKSGEDFEIQLSKTRMTQARALLQLAKGSGIDVMVTMTSKERERQLMPIRIPVDQGIAGWRLLLINKSDQPKFDKVKTIDDLRQLVAGQGSGWPDTTILAANDLPVATGLTHEMLFKMLTVHRFDYFPRSIVEIWEEATRHAHKGIVVENTIALHYPATGYFFVNKYNRKLAAQIENGCERAIKDGSFQELTTNVNKQFFSMAKLKSRKIFHLKNPTLPAETPLDKKEYWYSVK